MTRGLPRDYSQLGLHSKFEASQDYILRFYLKKTKQETNKKPNLKVVTLG